MRCLITKSLATVFLALSLAAGAPGLSFAQTSGSGTNSGSNTGTGSTTGTGSNTGTGSTGISAGRGGSAGDTSHTDGGRGFNWGWLGLVGLIGLAGLVRGNGRSDDRHMGSTINPNRP